MVANRPRPIGLEANLRKMNPISRPLLGPVESVDDRGFG